jgi:protein TonB
LSTYRLTRPYERPPLQRRVSGLALAVAINVFLLLMLLTLGRFAPEAKKVGGALVVDLLPESHSLQAPQESASAQKAAEQSRAQSTPLPKPPIVIPTKPTIAVPPPSPAPAPSHNWPLIEMSKTDLDAADVRNLPKAGAGSAGDSEVVGQGPHGETLYAAEWARHPTDAELGGYLPKNAPDGFGEIACKTIPDDRVEDCVEIDQTPGSHLASAVRQAAWQFRVRPPRKNGVPLVGSWVEIHIDYETIGRGD